MAKELKEKYDLKYFVLRSYGNSPPESDCLEVLRGIPEYEEICRYLHASDAVLWPRAETEEIVVSSMFFQCLGAVTPLVAPDVKYVELMGKEIVKYKNRKDLKEKVVRLIYRL